MKIAVIGSGISGLSAAYYLSKSHKVDLFEKQDHFGGHAYTLEVDLQNKIIPVDIGFIFITIGARKTPSALVGIIMLTEAILGPLWAWIFINENPPIVVLFGGSIVLFAVVIQFFNLKIEN